MRQSLKTYKEITAILEGFYLCKIVSQYAKSIFACMPNKLKEYKRIWRIRQEYFDVLYHGRRNFKDTNPLMSSLLVIFVWGGEAIL